jgi:hypothetical protein
VACVQVFWAPWRCLVIVRGVDGSRCR